ncbi:MAG: ABC transporter ATP-binding protein [Candidatus Diapherotrites archaeon]|nr:ABC transporter ATP-binding protein [Candidatus Diapherotrites archaeon]
MDRKTPLLEVKNVNKVYSLGKVTVTALKKIDLQIFEQDYISIMGPSGSGKTTLLDVISTLLRPTQGDVLIEGKSTQAMGDEELAKIRGKTIGFVFQTFNLIPTLTALENVSLPLWFQDIPIQEREKIAQEKLLQVGLSDRMHHKPNELSGGQRQRVAIARALAVNPKVIVADEPTGNLDSSSGDQILKLFDSLNQEEHKTVIMVTHERSVAEHAQKIIYIKDGLIDRIEQHR